MGWLGRRGLEVCRISNTLSWSAVPFFVWRLSCSLVVRGCRVGGNKVTSLDFILSLRTLYDTYPKCETSYTFLLLWHSLFSWVPLLVSSRMEYGMSLYRYYT